MSAKLDQSLDDILSTQKKTARGRGRGGRRAPNATRTTVVGPVGGVKKSVKNTRGAVKAAVPSGPAAGNGESKIIVSNLPPDVSEVQIKEYFGKSVGAVKRALITYGPNGVSRGIATITFSRPNSANDALIKLNGLLVDKRPMKIEVVLDASRAPPPAPIKGLGERIAKPKGQQKSAPTPKTATNGTDTRGGRGGGRGGRRGRNAGRPKTKTSDELDAEMADYFDATAVNGIAGGIDTAATTNGVAQPATNGGEDLGMDEIL